MTRAQLESLIDRHVAGCASPEEVARLSRELEANSEARLHYLRMAGLHAALASEEPLRNGAVAAAEPAFRRSWRGPLAWAAAFAVMAAVGALAWRERSSSVGRVAAEEVARLGKLENVRWVASETHLQAGDPLRAGQVLELSTGTAIVEFVSGARVTLIGPSIFELTSGNGGFLSLGQLKAVAETPQSKGFTVRTRTARVVDIGTEFVAAAAPDGQSRVDVTQGEVQVHVAGAGLPQRLRTGEALAVEAGSGSIFVRIESGDGTAAFRFPTIEPPSAADLADRSQGRATIRAERSSLHLTAPIPSGPPELLLDGRGQSAADSPAESVFFDNDVAGALLLDLGASHAITKINTYSWHQSKDFENRVRAVQKFVLYGFAGDVAPPVTGAPAEGGWVPLARVDSDDSFRVMQPVDRPAQQACSITGAHGIIGRYRYLLWEVHPTEGRRGLFLNNTFYAEFDVYGEP